MRICGCVLVLLAAFLAGDDDHNFGAKEARADVLVFAMVRVGAVDLLKRRRKNRFVKDKPIVLAEHLFVSP